MSNRNEDQLPIEVDDEDIEETNPVQGDANSDAQLDRDENEAIDKSNIIPGDGLRHAKPQTQNQYNEGPDEDELP